MKTKAISVVGALALSWVTLPQTAVAGVGVSNTVHYTQPTKMSIGLEPVITFNKGAGLSGNLRFNYGLSDLSNLNLLIGSGGGSKNFRFGGNLTFDFFPDIQGQPGIGMAVQGIYYRTPAPTQADASATIGLLDLVGIPYIHKTFKMSGSDEIEPFFAVPLGLQLSDGRYTGQGSLVFGTLFTNHPKFRYSMELGIGVSSNTQSYFSAALIYVP
ncbi:MAG: hypothetical protein JNL01_13500 [Bdellovibrionales bacterium]|nr:hypothetical protein [Bdellovibrionales bacterium]